VHPITGHEGPEVEYWYSSTFSLTSALDGLGGQRHAPAAKTRYPLYRRLGGPQSRCGRVRNISPPLGFDSRTVPGIIFYSCLAFNLDIPARWPWTNPVHLPLSFQSCLFLLSFHVLSIFWVIFFLTLVLILFSVFLLEIFISVSYWSFLCDVIFLHTYIMSTQSFNYLCMHLQKAFSFYSSSNFSCFLFHPPCILQNPISVLIHVQVSFPYINVGM